MSRWLTLFLLLPLTGLQAGLVTQPGDRSGAVVESMLDQDFFVLLGQVAQPGKYALGYSYDGSLNLLQALQNAGGHTSPEAVPKITIVRKTPQGNKFIRVNTRALLILKDEKYDLFVRRYDVIIVGPLPEEIRRHRRG